MQTRTVSALPRGFAFTRAIQALARTGGNREFAIDSAKKSWGGAGYDTLQVLGRDVIGAMQQRAAVAAGSTSGATFAGPISYATFAENEFSALVTEGAIIGKLTGLRRAPLNIAFPVQTAAAGVGWVGEGQPIAVSKLAFSLGTLSHFSLAGLVVLTMELAKNSSLDATALVQRDLLTAAIQYADRVFIDPSFAAVVGVSPASITNGATSTTSTGSTAVQIATDLETIAGGMADDGESEALYWIMTRRDAIKLAAKRDTAGAPAFPNVRADGGELLGIPVITSNSVPHSVSGGSIVALVNAAGIIYGEEPDVDFSVSSGAALQMDTAPVAGATTVVALFQTNSIAIRLTRFVAWAKARTTAVRYLDGVHW